MRNPKEKCTVDWEDRYGTTVSGNLPQYKVGECIEDVVNIATVQASTPWVELRDFHYYNMMCPYSNEAFVHKVRDLDPSSAHYLELYYDVLIRSNHTATGGIMIRYTMGARKHGWLCVDPSCPYFLSESNRPPHYYYDRYFYF